MAQSVDLLRKLINRKVLLHSIFWVTILIIVFLSENWEHQNNFKTAFFIQYVFAFIIYILVSYFNIYYLIKKYFTSKRYLTYFILLLLVLFIGAFTILILKNIFLELKITTHDELIHGKYDISYFIHVLFGELMFLIATTFFFIMEEWIRLQGITIKMQEAEGQKIQSELQALKAQINPHFLFNTLNNIYSHSLDNSPKTPEMILKLSELMSYILYECHDEKVPIKNELNFVRNYIELEKLRFEDQISVELDILESQTDIEIVPLIFIAFIENAFKHLGSSGKNKPCVKVNIDIQDDTIYLKVVNSINKDNPRKSNKESGVGIENVCKRLELLYPGSHKLEILESEQEYKIELRVKSVYNNQSTIIIHQL